MSNPLDKIIKLAQKCIDPVPVIVLGTGASIPYGVGGMAALQTHLLTNIKPDPKDEDIWKQFCSILGKTGDLELALSTVHLPVDLEKKVVVATREMVLRDDLLVLQKVVNGSVQFTLSTLLQYFLRTTHPKIHIVTTNYDRLAEYACDAASVPYETGFKGGYVRTYQSSQAHRPNAQIVEILKVHGSLDWYLDGNQNAIALPDSVNAPTTHSPLIVTPGVSKYLVTHDDPFRTVIGRSDGAFASARSVFCVGYGFNDRHIQPKLIQRVLKDKVPILILAKTLTPKTKEFLTQCKHPNYLALEAYGSGTRAYCHDQPNGVELPEPIWEFQNFVKTITG